MNKEHDNKGFMSVYTLIREKGLECKEVLLIVISITDPNPLFKKIN